MVLCALCYNTATHTCRICKHGMCDYCMSTHKDVPRCQLCRKYAAVSGNYCSGCIRIVDPKPFRK